MVVLVEGPIIVWLHKTYPHRLVCNKTQLRERIVTTVPTGNADMLQFVRQKIEYLYVVKLSCSLYETPSFLLHFKTLIGSWSRMAWLFISPAEQ